MRKIILLLLGFFWVVNLYAQQQVKLKKKDRRRDVAMQTSEGTIVLRLYDSTPLHRDNFLRFIAL